jgi:hypothetical protein
MAKPDDESARNPYWHDHDRGEQECPACIWVQRLADGVTPCTPDPRSNTKVEKSNSSIEAVTRRELR